MIARKTVISLAALIIFLSTLVLFSGGAFATEPEEDKDLLKSDNAELFLFVMILSFGVGAIVLGAFTAFFGSGKSRVFGSVLTVAGILVYLNYIYFKLISSGSDTLLGIVHWSDIPFVKVLLVVIGFIVGLVIALIIFLVGIIKS